MTGAGAWRPRGWPATRLRILERDAYRCHLCGRGGADSIDHLIPRYRGGGHHDANLAACHMTCNSRKGNRKPKVELPHARRSRWG
jgi:5-methylcytosine-specific restriction endonuclease McrA